ncbi:MAG: HEPN domain-containing protein [Planctomycetota bacterium]
MKRHEDAKRKIVAEWLDKACADMDLARHLLAENAAFPNAIGFHSQQAVEKYLKAFLTWHQVPFPKTHDLDELLDIIAGINKSLAASLRNAIILTPYGVEVRYPGGASDITPKDAAEAVKLGLKVSEAIQSRLKGMKRTD